MEDPKARSQITIGSKSGSQLGYSVPPPGTKPLGVGTPPPRLHRLQRKPKEEVMDSKLEPHCLQIWLQARRKKVSRRRSVAAEAPNGRLSARRYTGGVSKTGCQKPLPVGLS